MSEGNLNAVRTLFDEFARREIELTFRIFDEQITWDARGTAIPELDRVFHGHDGVRAFWRGWFEAWERIDFTDGPYHQASGTQVVSWWKQLNQGKGSGVVVEQDAGFVWTFESDRIVRVSIFFSRDEAFRAAGLEP